MLELFAFDTVGAVVDPAAARAQHVQVLDVAACRRMAMVPLLGCVFVNGRFEDSSGAVVRVTWADVGARDTVQLTAADLAQLVTKYGRYEQAVAGVMQRDELELGLWGFLRTCHERGLVVLSRSRLFLQEYE